MSGVDGSKRAQARAESMRYLAHDMNSPLTSIRILAEMLGEEIDDPELKRDVADIIESADAAGVLVEGLTSTICAEAEPALQTMVPVELVSIVHQVSGRPSFAAQIEVRAGASVGVVGNPVALRRAMTDVLANAKRLVPPRAKVVVSVSTDGESAVIRVRHPGALVDSASECASLMEFYGAGPLRRKNLPVWPFGLGYAFQVIRAHGATFTFHDADEDDAVDLVLTFSASELGVLDE